uniref:KEN domain-containing protein n=1 Tax=Chrysemys picta bellii TaxID=8478 RepID=A0A8C3HRJ5_CHRPI
MGQSQATASPHPALRRLVLYVVTVGKVPFEENDRHNLDVNCSEDVQDYVEIADLRESLVFPDEGSPVENLLRDLIQHPFFWSNRYRFLRDVGNESDIKTRNTKHHNNESEILKALNCDEHPLQQWTEQIDKLVLDSMLNPFNKNKKNQNKNKKKQYENYVTDLLKFIRNMGEVKEIIKEPSEYFLNLFPELTVYVYKCLRSIQHHRHFPSPQSLSQL